MGELVPLSDIRQMAEAVGPLFGKSPKDMLALMLIAQAEGKHPALAAQEYDIIHGRPALKSTAVVGRFQAAGGRVEWIKRDDTGAAARFSHPQSSDVVVKWGEKEATAAGLINKDMWKKFPRQMYSARVAAEGVRACFPACLSGLYTTDEVAEFEPRRERNVTWPVSTIEDTISRALTLGATTAEDVETYRANAAKYAGDELARFQEKANESLLKAIAKIESPSAKDALLIAAAKTPEVVPEPTIDEPTPDPVALAADELF